MKVYGSHDISGWMTTLRMLLISGLMIIPEYSPAVQEQRVSPSVQIALVDFLYVEKSGYDSQYNFEKSIERQIILPALRKSVLENSAGQADIVLKTVLKGNLDYLETARTVRSNEEIYTDYDLLIWGLVRPVQWPADYDLTILMFTNRGRYPGTLLDVDLVVRNKRLIEINSLPCDLPEYGIASIPRMMAAKLDLFLQGGDKAGSNSELNRMLIEEIPEYARTCPRDALTGLLKWDPGSREVMNRIGYVELELDKNESVVLDLPRDIYNELEDMLLQRFPLSRTFEQSGLALPDISIKSGETPDYIPQDPLIEIPFRMTTDKFLIGIMPFKNNSKVQGTGWLSFGLDYLLSNKLAAVPDFQVMDRSAFMQAVQQAREISGDTTRLEVQSELKTSGYNLGLSGSYLVDNEMMLINLNVINTLDGDTISSRQFVDRMDNIFGLTDEVVSHLVTISEVYITPTDQRKLNRRLTSSPEAFRYFCLGYLANEHNRNFSEILDYFNRAIEADPLFWEAQYNLGITYYNMGDFTSALDKFNFLIDYLPNFGQPYLGRALTFFSLSKPDAAEHDLKMLIRLMPFDYHGYYYLGKLYLQRREYASAKTYLEEAAELKPGDSDIYYDIGNSYFEQHQYNRALPYYVKVMELNPDHHAGRQKLGTCYYHSQKFSHAAECFIKILRTRPDDPDAHFMLGITIYKQAVLDEFIVAFLEMMQTTYPGDSVQTYRPKLPEGRTAEVYSQIIRQFRQALASRPDFYEAAFNLALTYQDMGNLDSARVYLERTLRINPGSVKASLVAAKVYEQQGKIDQAMDKYKNVVKIEPAYFVHDPVMDERYDQIDIIKTVVAELEADLRENPDDLAANLSLARIFYAQGFYGKAANISRKILATHPGNPSAQDILAKIDRW